MYFLLTTVGLARGAQLTPANVIYSLILLSSTWGAYVATRQVEGFGLFLGIPLIILLLLWNLAHFSPSVQTVLGVLIVFSTVVLLWVVLPPQVQLYSERGMSLDDWNLFRAYVAAIPCMCCLFHIVISNPNQRNILILGLPLVVSAGFSFYALRILLG
jgi:hypothetical protein